MYLGLRVLIVVGFFWSAIAVKDRSKLGNLLTQTKEVHDLCKDITGATEEMMDQVENGNFIEDEEIKRYILCLWRATRIIDTNHNLHAGIFQDLVPEGLEDTPLYAATKKCIGLGLNSDHKEYYDKTYEVAKCMYKADPDNFFLL